MSFQPSLILSSHIVQKEVIQRINKPFPASFTVNIWGSYVFIAENDDVNKKAILNLQNFMTGTTHLKRQ